MQQAHAKAQGRNSVGGVKQRATHHEHVTAADQPDNAAIRCVARCFTHLTMPLRETEFTPSVNRSDCAV